MRKVLFTLLGAVLIVLLVSCGVSPSEAMQNLQNPKITFKTSLKVPVVATSVDIGGMVEDYIDDIKEDIEGVEIKEGNPIVIGLSATIVDISPEASEMPEFSQEIPLDIDLDIPKVEGTTIKVSVDLPSFSSQNVVLNLPGLPEEDDYPSGATESSIDMGIDSSKLDSFEVRGEVKISVSLPSDWTDVSVTSIQATITDGNGNVVESGDYPAESNSVSIDLSGKTFEVGGGVMKIEYSITFHSGSTHGSGDVTISISPDLSVSAVNGLVIDVNKTIDKPSGVESLTFKSGRIVISSDEVNFTGVDGTINGKALSTDNGKIIADLSGVSLPIDISITKINAEIPDGGISEVEMSVDLENIEVDEMTISNDELEIASDTKIDLGNLSDIVQSVKFKSGKIKVKYDSTLPVDVRIAVNSPDFSPAISDVLTIEANTSSETYIDLSGRELNISDYLRISYNASPVGYDGETLTLRDVELGDDIHLQATITLDDVELESVTLQSTTIEKSDEVDLTGISTPMREMLSYFDMSGTITSTADLDGYLEMTVNSSSASVSFEEGSIPLGPILELVKEALTGDATALDYTAKLVINGMTLQLDEPLRMILDVEMPLVADFGDEGKEIELYNDKVSLGAENPESFIVDSATVVVAGANTSSFKPTLVIYINNRKNEIALGGSVNGSISLTSDDLKVLSETGEIPIKVAILLKGPQAISSVGKMDVRIKLEADLTVSTGGGVEK